MRKIALFAYCLCMFSLLTGCTDNKISVTLQQIDTLMTEHPDSALKQLDSPETKLNIRNRMRINKIMDKLVELNRPHAKEVGLGSEKTAKKSEKPAKKADKKTEKKAKKAKK